MARTFDPITLEILWRRLISIVDEADSSVARTAFSSLLRDAHDYTCMFTDRYGRELAQGTFATPGQSGAMALGIKNLVTRFPADFYAPGDVFITNDPWALAGHLNDVCVMSPIFYEDRLTAFTACVFHHSDIGGRVSSDNHDVFEEGLFIPFVKLYDRGELNEAVLDMIRWNVRTRDEVIGDIRSQIAANHVCSEKIVQMLKENRLDTLDDLADQIIGLTEQSIREEIEKIPDGIYRSQGIIEQMKGDDIVIQAAVEVKGSDIVVDLAGSSGQVNWGGNVVFNFTYAYVFMAIKSMFAPDVPNNEGCARPIKLTAPEGSVVNCRFPAAVAARMGVGHFMTEIIYRALAEVVPQKVIAGSGGTPAAMNVFYGRRNDGRPWHSVIIRGGGMGAGAANDGNYVYIFPANGANTPVEIFESDTPLIVEKRELLADSGGPGRMKGGLGKRELFRVPDEDRYAPIPPVNLGIQAGRFVYPAEGLFGGMPGAKARFLVNGKPGNPYGLTQLKPGDLVTIDAAGGGGFGEPLERDPELVQADVIEGYVTTARAKSDYGVVLKPKTFEIDWEQTRKMRGSRVKGQGSRKAEPH